VKHYPHPEGLVVPEIQWHNGYFSVCGTIYQDINGVCGRILCTGQLADEDYPEEFRKFLPFHLFNANGPMHYVENAMFLSSALDCWGLAAGEVKHLGMWQLPYRPPVTGDKPPPQEWEPVVRVGTGKEPNLAAARKVACWPDAELCDFTTEKLLARLPALMKEFVTVCREYLPQEVIDKWK
jgi:hypothetical protein